MGPLTPRAAWTRPPSRGRERDAATTLLPFGHADGPARRRMLSSSTVNSGEAVARRRNRRRRRGAPSRPNPGRSQNGPPAPCRAGPRSFRDARRAAVAVGTNNWADSPVSSRRARARAGASARRNSAPGPRPAQRRSPACTPAPSRPTSRCASIAAANRWVVGRDRPVASTRPASDNGPLSARAAMMVTDLSRTPTLVAIMST